MYRYLYKVRYIGMDEATQVPSLRQRRQERR